MSNRDAEYRNLHEGTDEFVNCEIYPWAPVMLTDLIQL